MKVGNFCIFYSKSVLGNLDPYLFMCYGSQVQHIKKYTSYLVFSHKCPNSYFYSNHWCFGNLPGHMGQRIWIWTPKKEILGLNIVPIWLGHTIYFFAKIVGQLPKILVTTYALGGVPVTSKILWGQAFMMGIIGPREWNGL